MPHLHLDRERLQKKRDALKDMVSYHDRKQDCLRNLFLIITSSALLSSILVYGLASTWDGTQKIPESPEFATSMWTLFFLLFGTTAALLIRSQYTEATETEE